MAIGLTLITRGAVDAALEEFVRLGREGFLHKYGFGQALNYFVQDPLTGTWADSKAIVGAAYGTRFPDRGPLRPTDFSGGEVQVVRLLRELGYQVGSRSETTRSTQHQDIRTWSRAEVELVVADYLEMLALELASQNYNKSSRRRLLLPLLNRRSDASVEYKRRNISAVLLDLGYPCLKGYLPAANGQELLVEVIEAQLADHPALDRLAQAFTELPAIPISVAPFDHAKIPPPSIAHRTLREPPPRFRAIKRDYLEREANNRSLGMAGEQFMVGYEQWHLASKGLGQLAERVRHVSVEDGDGIGYDIRSFDEWGNERFLEVKTTALGELTPFFISANEVRFSEVESARFTICRLFDFRASPRFFELPGSVTSTCVLDAHSYRASPR